MTVRVGSLPPRDEPAFEETEDADPAVGGGGVVDPGREAALAAGQPCRLGAPLPDEDLARTEHGQ
jgi:hypothetical protein